MSSYNRLTQAQIAQQVARLAEARLPATLAELAALMASLELEASRQEASLIQYTSESLPKEAAVVLLHKGDQPIKELWLYFADIAAEDDATEKAQMEAALADTKAALKARLGKPLPEYPCGKTKGEIYGEEGRYDIHRLPNGLDILVARGVDPTKPVQGKNSRWRLSSGHLLELRVTKRTFALALQLPKPAQYDDGLAVMWDGSATAPEPAPETLPPSPSPTQTELLAALTAAPWPADKARLSDLLTRMGFKPQFGFGDAEPWVKDEWTKQVRRAVIRTNPDTSTVLLASVVVDDVFAKKRKGPPFKGMEHAFDLALAHAETLLGAPTIESAAVEPATPGAAALLRLAQWRKDGATVSLMLEYRGPDSVLSVDWRVEPDGSGGVSASSTANTP